HEYALSINSSTFKGFANRDGESAEWYPVWFKTRATGAPPAARELTVQQNRNAIKVLLKTIDEEYSYRDRRGIDWGVEIERRRAAMEAAGTVNEFARTTAHLLRLAEDQHIWVEAGAVKIYTRANSTPPNFNFQTLRKKVAQWKEHD